MNDNQGRGIRPPRVGLLDIGLAMAIGYALYQALMFLWESP